MSAGCEDGSGGACNHPTAPPAKRHKNISWSPSTEHFCMKNSPAMLTPRPSSIEGRRMTKRKNAMAILAASDKEDSEKEDAEQQDAEQEDASKDILDYMLQTWITEQQKEEEDAGTVLNEPDAPLTEQQQEMLQTSTSTTSTVQLLMSDVEPLTDVQHASIWFMCV